jgi:exodeoxyribonuclease-3
MKIASWNVNSIKARKDHVLKWLDDTQTDILFMQELKGVEDNFPKSDFEDREYHLAINGQKTYNGVAIASKHPITVISDEILEGDEQARFLDIEINGIRMINVYCPNGNPVDSEKYPYKLNWTENLANHLNSLFQKKIPFLIGGDFNIIPMDIDCHDPQAWEGDALFRQESWDLWRTMKNIGLYDAYRMIHPHEADCYSFWDYQAGAWPQNKGIRIDHFLLSPEIADQLKDCHIDRTPRGWEKASDHTPIIIEI